MNRFIVIEGLDGSGKTTQIAKLKEKFGSLNIPSRHIKLPDYDDPSSTLVKMYLSGAFGDNALDVNAYAASAFYAVDRYASFVRHWKPDYDNRALILADRYVSSNAIHQMVKLPQNEWDGYLAWLQDFEYGKLGIPKPDKVIFLDMPVEISQKLLIRRYDGQEAKKDLHEKDASYLLKCREAALYAAQRMNWEVINCSENDNPLSIEKIHGKICSSLEIE